MVGVCADKRFRNINLKYSLKRAGETTRKSSGIIGAETPFEAGNHGFIVI